MQMQTICHKLLRMQVRLRCVKWFLNRFFLDIQFVGIKNDAVPAIRIRQFIVGDKAKIEMEAKVRKNILSTLRF
jgi:hypothetical protein